MARSSGVALQALRNGVQDVAVKVLAAPQGNGIAEGIQLQILRKVSYFTSRSQAASRSKASCQRRMHLSLSSHRAASSNATPVVSSPCPAFWLVCIPSFVPNPPWPSYPSTAFCLSISSGVHSCSLPTPVTASGISCMPDHKVDLHLCLKLCKPHVSLT